MKEYYCKEMRGDGEECGETRKEKFYSGIKSACKYCQSKKVYKKEKERKEKEIEEEDEAVSNQEVLDKLGELMNKKFEMYDKAYIITKDRIDEMVDEIEELKKVTKELKNQNKELVKTNDIYKHKIKSLEIENKLLNRSAINLDKRIGNYEYKNYFREDDPRREGFKLFKELESLKK
jgi:hypothetical protein